MQNNILTLIDQIEIHSNKKLNYRKTIFLLIESSKNNNLSSDFENLIFLAKFIFNVKRILSNKTLAEENYKNLIIEFQKNFNNFISILKNISSNFENQDRIEFEKQFLDNTNSEALYLLIDDLCEIKNYEIDKKLKPF